MGVRKNALFLDAAEIDNFVQACVLMKADIVNPAASAANQYSKWDEFVAIHQMIQDAFGPGDSSVNFGHGGSSEGAYSFLSWHRFFLRQFELQLQSYVPGVMLPYWDWTDPTPIMTDTFMGPNGTTSDEVRSGYFAASAPGTAGNPTPAPAWWPAGLTGWQLPAAFGSSWLGALRRNTGSASLPSTTDISEALAKSDYHDFTWALESGEGLSSGHSMHNEMHVWIGGHMGNPAASPFDPLFYLHHCNIDRLWAMWQLDGHATEYPSAGALPLHGPTDLMYPWVGSTAGFGTNRTIGTGAANIPMPDFSALGAQANEDTLDFRTAYGYSYDTLATIGVGLDRTGSMSGLTPDPMTTGAPDVTKWEAATRGVSMFLQDCETVQSSGITYVNAGIKTFRRLTSNDFAAVLPAPGYGLIKTGGTYSKSAFDAAVAAMTTGGSTPLADALLDVQSTMVEPPFGGLPTDERRYLAMLTDGLLTSGSPLSSIADGSFTRTAVFAMGFGTGADVDYTTLQTLVDKGVNLGFTQVFHGESAGTIDKFYSDALARAIGFTAVFDPVVELFEGEHAHLEFRATDADDAFLLTAQGMDFRDENWTFALHGPDGSMLYGSRGHQGAHGGCHCCRQPHVTVKRSRGRLTVMLQRNLADAACWVGRWNLLVAYRARNLDSMLMPEPGDLIFPLGAGPSRGQRYARLLVSPKQRTARRNVHRRPLHGLDLLPLPTNRSHGRACDLVMNIYARSRLRIELTPRERVVDLGAPIAVDLLPSVLGGSISDLRAFARFAGPSQDLAAALATVAPRDWMNEPVRDTRKRFDPALALAKLERKNPKLTRLRDEELLVVSHHGGPLHIHTTAPEAPGAYHVGLIVEGTYCSTAKSGPHGGGHGGHGTAGHGGGSSANPACPPECPPQRFTRVLSTMVVVRRPGPKARAAKSGARKRRR